MGKNYMILSSIVMLLLVQKFTDAQATTQWEADGFVKIENGLAGLNSNIASGDIFGQDHDKVGDVDGDGIIDLVVGSRTADDGGVDNGAVHILFMNNDGTVRDNQKISMLEGGFTGILTTGNNFGYGVAGIGDYDGDGIPDIAVAAPLTNDQAVYILHLNADGTVKSHVKNEDIPCIGISAVGDLNNDGRIDLVACDPNSDLDGANIGAIRILFFDANSTVIPAQTKLINPSNGGFGTGLLPGDQFGGREVAMLGDINNDGTLEMAVGAFRSDGGKGAIWMLSLNSTTLDVVSKLKITEGLNGFTGTLSSGTNQNGSNGAQFGHALCNAGDLNGDGVPDIMTGANQQSEGFILYLNDDKTVNNFTKINNDEGGFALALQPNERFSRSISYVGDLREDGSIAVVYGGGAGGSAGGTLYLLFFKSSTALPVTWLGVSVERLKSGQVELKWKTATEQNNHRFIIQRLQVGRTWQDVGTVDGNGTVSTEQEYGFIDESAPLGHLYYRIAQTDFTGETNISGIYPVDEVASASIDIYPNPVSDILFIGDDFSTDANRVQIFNQSGQLITTSFLTENSISVASLKNGSYYLLIGQDKIPFVKMDLR